MDEATKAKLEEHVGKRLEFLFGDREHGLCMFGSGLLVSVSPEVLRHKSGTKTFDCPCYEIDTADCVVFFSGDQVLRMEHLGAPVVILKFP